MFTTIMVPLDGSANAERAVPYAEKLARATGATLALVRAETSGITGSRVIALRQALAYLETVAQGLRARGLTVQTVAPYGQPAAGVIHEARRLDADLIVLATHGRSGVGHLAYGSVAEEILAGAPAAVLLIGARGNAPAATLADGAPILVPLDGTAFAERSLPVARDLAALLGGGVVLVQALPEPDMPSPAVPSYISPQLQDLLQEEEVATLEYLREIARQELPGVETTCVARPGRPARVLAEVGRDFGVGLVVMATHRRFGLARFFFGNVANDAIHETGIPFLLVGAQPAGDTLHDEQDLAGIVLG